MKTFIRLSLSFACVMALSLPLAAAPLTLKLASWAPENSPVGKGLGRLSSEWKRVSGGAIQLKVFHNGIMGDDESVRQHLNTGFIDAGLFTSAGLAIIVRDFMALSAPGIIRDQKEYDYVVKALLPELNRKLEDKGYVNVVLTSGGWIRLFSRNPVATPEELRRVKLVVSPYDVELQQILKVAGMNLVISPRSSSLQLLQTGAGDCFYTSPVYFSYQWSSYSKVIGSMTDVPIAPFLGGVIMRKASWEKIPVARRAELLAVADGIAADIGTEMLGKEATVIDQLRKSGMKVVPVDQNGRNEWNKVFSDAVSNSSVDVFPRVTVEKVRSLVKQYRAGGN